MSQDNRSFSGKDTKKAEQGPIPADRSNSPLIKDDAAALEVMLGNTGSSKPSARKGRLELRLTKIYSRASARRRIAFIYLGFAALLICLLILGLVELLERATHR